MAESRRAVANCLERQIASNPPPDDALFLVAVSGGADSLALAWAAAFVIPRSGYRLAAIIVDHGLQEGSADIAADAKTTLEDIGVATTVIPVDLGDAGNIEARARQARYQVLEDVATQRNAYAVLLGHTLDDQAETVLMGLTRGSGPESIHGMDEVTGLWWRPFLALTRNTTTQVCRDVPLSWWEDPHNSDPRFLRPRIRHEVMPLLEQTMGPGVAEALVRTAQLLRQDNEVLGNLTKKVLEGLADGPERGMVPISHIASEPVAIASRVIRFVAQQSLGSSLSHTHTEQVWRLVSDWKGQGPIDIPGGRVERQEKILRFIPDSGQHPREEHS